MSESTTERRRVIDVKTNEEIVVDVDSSQILSSEDEQKRTITYLRKVEPYLKQIIQWRSKGKGIAQICKLLDISVGALYEYKRNIPEVAEALNAGNELLSDSIEESMYNEALGYTYEEEALTKTGKVVSLKKFARPSIAAGKLVLPKLRPGQWNPKVKDDAGVGGVTIAAIQALTKDEIRKFIAAGIEKNEEDK